MNKVKNLWYKKTAFGSGEDRTLLPDGYVFEGTHTTLYEANIPPLLRYFHIQNISPSGWIQLPKKKTLCRPEKKTTCKYEFEINYKDIVALNDKETIVPYKICSFDIEASSSHGDFPIPIKTYKKLASNLVDKLAAEPNTDLSAAIYSAFGYDKMDGIERVYPKKMPSPEELAQMISYWIQADVREQESSEQAKEMNTIEKMFEAAAAASPSEDVDAIQASDERPVEMEGYNKPFKKSASAASASKGITVKNIFADGGIEREEKIVRISSTLNAIFPKLEGDKVTFIGSTFVKYGEKEPHLNHCISLNTCSTVPGAEIESYSTEKEVLLAWKDLIQRENPDIIVGYNIFGFDYEFMFRRAQENGIVKEFLQLSRNIDELCGNEKTPGKITIEESSTSLASGQYELRYIKMTGRLQVDLLNYFRREFQLTSYKLDNVSSYFISDDVLDRRVCDGRTEIVSKNLMGLQVDGYIHFEETSHSTDYYKDGAKFRVVEIDRVNKRFWIEGEEAELDMRKKVKWGLAKDDVSPQDIFRLTSGSADDRALIAKYCIQDCNLVQNLLRKVDVITGYIEMARICSVPISFLVFRGQSIKLTSYVAKKCREKETLMPVIDKGASDEGYEGAIVLEPKCNIYLDNPVACVDYASLYPSSMISENISHDSKVWTREYDLEGRVVDEWGEKNADGEFVYDNLPGYKYVDVTYDTYAYVRPKPGAAAKKVKTGKKVCRFAQFPEGKAIMPSILEELLKARKTTRKQAEKETDEFMQNVLDKRQLSYKLTANSLYGQCGAKISTFYEKDVAASVTATGRLLLTYAKKIIETCYGNTVCNTSGHGPVLTKAEYIYGDSVTNYTPVYVKHNNKLDILTIEELAEKYGDNKWIHCKEEGKQEKEFCELENIESWTEKGWTKLYRVIRHKLAPHKNIIRILTPQSSIDVTDDHSLLLKSGEEISPKNVSIGTELKHHSLHTEENKELIEDFLKCADNARKFDRAKMLLHLNLKNLGEQIIMIKKIDYEGYVYDLTTENHHFAAGVGNMIVHNTDSVFFTFNLEDPVTGEPVRGKKALEITIELAQEAGHLASSFLKAPQDLEYEKTFMPFILLSKKRYVGMLYETNPNKCKQKSMGIVLKRRDNANIVKDVYGGIIDILMKGGSDGLMDSIQFMNSQLLDLVEGRTSMDKLVVTKSLRSDYKKPEQIAHKVLADRIAKRDPGNKPNAGDRIPYVYIVNKNKNALQGDCIDIPNYIVENKLQIDYKHYIENQVMNPLLQLYSLVIDELPYMRDHERVEMLRRIEKVKNTYQDSDKLEDKICETKEKYVKKALFDEYLNMAKNKQTKQNTLMSLWKAQPSPPPAISLEKVKSWSKKYKAPVSESL